MDRQHLRFGGTHTSTGALPDNRFPARRYQSGSGLYRNWMRDYDPTTGRYLQAGLLGLMGGASVCGYVRQNPGRWVDPQDFARSAMRSIPLFQGGRLLSILESMNHTRIRQFSKNGFPWNATNRLGWTAFAPCPCSMDDPPPINGTISPASRKSMRP